MRDTSDGASGDIAPVSGFEDTVIVRQKIIFDGDVVKIFDHRHRNFKHFRPLVVEFGIGVSFANFAPLRLKKEFYRKDAKNAKIRKIRPDSVLSTSHDFLAFSHRHVILVSCGLI